MRTIVPVLVVVIALPALAALQTTADPAGADTPRVEIANDRIHAVVRIPDPQTGYYRATRFDWSGSIASLEWQGHQYFGRWSPSYDPLTHDAITGPVEEFVEGIGYERAELYGLFLRIGVGAVRKPQESAYRQFHTYEIADNGTWTTHRGPDRVTFVHQIGDTNGYSYVYEKVLRLEGDSLVIEHTLRNTGREPIATPVYDHNFYMLDFQPTGPDVVVRVPFEARAIAPRNDLAQIQDRELRFTRQLDMDESAYLEIAGYGPTAADYDIRVENRRTGAAVRQTSDRPLSKLMFWARRSTVCPEPYIDLDIAPGASASWRITWEFYDATASRD